MVQTKKGKPKKERSRTKKRKFKNDDFCSEDGFVTRIWGPTLWHVLHTISFNYPVHPTKEHKREYMDFIYSLRKVMPCKSCRENLAMNMKHLPLTLKDMENRETFSRYIYELHEVINKMLKKKSNLSYYDVRDRYEQFRARCPEEEKKKKKKTKKVHLRGCTDSLYGKGSKCIIKIVPQTVRGKSMQIES